MINGNTAEYYINNQEEAERKCIEKNKFSRKFVKAIDNISPKTPKSDKGDYNPQ
ncbi:DNA-binding protein [Dickeya zeae]|nr:DNA-binding protein [Dickeya zeae]UJR60600.1 DNA-binding protein [Dickeya zeae]